MNIDEFYDLNCLGEQQSQNGRNNELKSYNLGELLFFKKRKYTDAEMIDADAIALNRCRFMAFLEEIL